jgi:hypothetical protein
MPVLWRILQADSAYWSSDPESIEERVLKGLGASPSELQRRLSAFWRQVAAVNRKGQAMVFQARNSSDLEKDVLPDLVHLERCLEVGVGFGGLLASYHQLVGDHFLGALEKQQLKQALALVNELQCQMMGTFSFDTVDPKGGDLSSWTLALQELRNNLLTMAQSEIRRPAEFR